MRTPIVACVVPKTPGTVSQTAQSTITDAAAVRVTDPAYFVCRGGPPV
jgi:hypothetical protein